ncbi:TetR/AcrR family transcriptional regulator [Paenibacillus hexagrammi]|uniref:TetR/AcrR family transcriptional regulator n=1 Tax=Paenibacillus hexagrammi TaxID=2908839 RepID=A0ABY3SBK5_9BACL|nr:TetR/AcrR family transcriptional regulator [Paenibacillus sp. YPD9-1]UJF31372.1 TetR/AcrR family transcriptional regulator [Paenibacillus sp. YPD9-1]
MPKDNELTKQKLLAAAVEMFTENGYYDTKISDIVKKAGVAQGTFYLYFQTKESIFTSIIKETNERMIHQIDHIFADHVSPEMSEDELKQRLYETISGCMSLYREHKAIVYMMRIHGSSQFAEAQRVAAECDESLLSIIIKLFKKFHLFPEYDQFQYQVAASAINGMMNETCMQYVILRDATDEDISKISRVVTQMIYDMTVGKECKS